MQPSAERSAARVPNAIPRRHHLGQRRQEVEEGEDPARDVRQEASEGEEEGRTEEGLTALRIREAERADLPAVLRLLRALDPPLAPEPDPAAAERVFARFAAYPDYAVYLAEDDGEPVGTFSLLILDNLAHGFVPEGIVENVVVAEGRRGQGLGAAMMRFAMDRCAEAGCYKLALSSNARREDAHRFYERLGFVRHGLSFSVPIPHHGGPSPETRRPGTP